jgi:hypothetical protein
VKSTILTSKRIDSQAELIEELRRSRSRTILLGKNSQQSREFILLAVKNHITDKELFRIGVISEGHGLKAQYEINESGVLAIGFNKEICLISESFTNFALTKEFNSLFYEFKMIKSNNSILVVCECEIYCLGDQLAVLWHLNSDLITNYVVTEDYVKIVTEGGIKTYSVVDGCTIACGSNI